MLKDLINLLVNAYDDDADKKFGRISAMIEKLIALVEKYLDL